MSILNGYIQKCRMKSLLIICFIAFNCKTNLVAQQNWSGWKVILSGGTTDMLPSAYEGKSSYLFSKGIADQEVYLQMKPGYNYNYTTGIVPGNFKTNTALASCGLNANAQNGNIQMVYFFAKGLNNHIYYNKVPDGSLTPWSGWSEIPDNGTTDAAPSAASNGEMIYVFTKGIIDHQIYAKMFVSAVGWGKWVPVPGGFKTNDRVLAIFQNFKIYLFAKDLNNFIFFNVLISGNWSGWQMVPGNITSTKPIGVGISATKGANGYADVIYLFVNDDSQRIRFNIGYTQSTTPTQPLGVMRWQGWMEVPGGKQTNSGVSVSRVQDGIQIFTLGIQDNQMYTNTLKIP